MQAAYLNLDVAYTRKKRRPTTSFAPTHKNAHGQRSNLYRRVHQRQLYDLPIIRVINLKKKLPPMIDSGQSSLMMHIQIV